MSTIVQQRQATGRAFTDRSLVRFFVATLLLTWVMGVVLVVFRDPIGALFGVGLTNPFYLLTVFAPGIVGVALVARHAGVAGLGSFFRRFALWRMSVAWWLVVLVGVPAIHYAGAALVGNDDGSAVAPAGVSLSALAVMFLILPLGELGWRGVALPLLQRRWAPLWASLVLGVMVATWTAPFVLLIGGRPSVFGPVFFAIVAASVIMTAMFNASRGSLLVSFVFYAQVNGALWPHAQPWDTWLLVVAAVVVVVVNRRAMLDRGQGVTSVIEHEAGRG